MRSTLRKIGYSTLLRPKYVRKSSQTLYETTLGCLALHHALGERAWLDEAIKAGRLLIDNQLPDGGFDIGYEFDFGKQRGLQQATAPECKAVVALAQLYRAQPLPEFAESIRRATE